MRIVIDLQGAQAASRFRGIGRYSLSFALALAREAERDGRGHEVWLALNGAFPESIEPIRAAFDGLVPQSRIRVWDAPRPTTGDAPENSQRRKTAEALREAALASLQPDWVVVCSLFESHMYTNEAVTSIGSIHRLPTAVVLYDLIPLIHAETYLVHAQTADWYRDMIDHLRRADLLFGISSSSAQEAVECLGFEPERVVAIGTDADARFRPLPVKPEQRKHLARTYGITRPFMLYVGGADWRKNCERLIDAYAGLPAAVRAAHQLVFAFDLYEGGRSQLTAQARKAGLSEGEFILTGFVPDEDLLLLYNACTGFVFPSWHEGFGLPALEAMRCGKAVLASNCSSLPEVVGREDALFDPFDVADITRKLERLLTDADWRRALEAHAAEQQKQFSWARTARRAWAALEAAQAARPARAAAGAPALVLRGGRLERPRLAYVSPLPPEQTGIADYSAQLLPDLCRWYQVEVITDQPQVCAPEVERLCPRQPVAHLLAHADRYDRVLYHFGNSQYHAHMWPLLAQVPGTVVLHDFCLGDSLYWRETQNHEAGIWRDALFHSHGYPALLAVNQPGVALGEMMVRYPANLRLLQAARGVIVHSEHARSLAERHYGSVDGAAAAADWAVVPMPRRIPARIDRKAARQALGFGEHELLVCSFGFTAKVKQSVRLLELWRMSALARLPEARLVFVGGAGDDTGEQLARLGARSAESAPVRHTGFIDERTYHLYLAAADIAVQLRATSCGETSAAVYDCLAYGLALIVNAHGSLAELPDEAVVKLPEQFSDAALIQALEALAAEPARRAALGARARAYMHARHHPRPVAARYAEALEHFARRAAETAPGVMHAAAAANHPPEMWPMLAASLGASFPPRPRPRQLLVDVSELVQRDAKSGLQ
ncbi:MAG: glycosyltransferase, partial [Casimicrobiaceae bacterium]